MIHVDILTSENNLTHLISNNIRYNITSFMQSGNYDTIGCLDIETYRASSVSQTTSLKLTFLILHRVVDSKYLEISGYIVCNTKF